LRPDWFYYAVGLLVVAMALAFVYDNRVSDRRRKSAGAGLKRLGADAPLSFGTCLSGLSGLPGPAQVYAGFRPGELVFVSWDGTEAGRVPLAAIQLILTGDWEEVGPYLEIGGEPVGLPERLDRILGKRRPRGYLVLEWLSESGETKRALFQHRDKKFAESAEKFFHLRRDLAALVSSLQESGAAPAEPSEPG
jgi:hypothetical protein